MTDIIVQRGDGTHVGDDVVDGLLCTDAVARERGRSIIDDSTVSSTLRLTMTYQAGALPGQLLRYDDAWSGRQRAKITGIRHRLELVDDVPVLTTEITARRPD